MLISFEDTSTMLQESETVRIDASSDLNSMVNRFKIKPQGILIQDTYNNPFFPIKFPQIDTSKMDLMEIFRRFRENYGQFESMMLPWHFCIEMVDSRYYVFNTRPLDQKFPLTNQDVVDRVSGFDEPTRKFFKYNIFDISEAIHICIVGDTGLDIYTKRIYEMIARFCINPFVRWFRLPEALNQRIFAMNIGKNFNVINATKFIK